jgi:hypothetical protein
VSDKLAGGSTFLLPFIFWQLGSDLADVAAVADVDDVAAVVADCCVEFSYLIFIVRPCSCFIFKSLFRPWYCLAPKSLRSTLISFFKL